MSKAMVVVGIQNDYFPGDLSLPVTWSVSNR
ncbi:hypothetical protein C4K23_3656 [Pseudomonas chlororaphis]|nr:hypothetical protein C4K23_3656 [Pseudomonas chlororaphis]ETD40674.1 hypothetical protein U724_01815 [Pseudomonas chlororaphis subsp. aurantiaca PB-St2]